VNCERFCFWHRQSVVFLFVYEISLELLNGFAPNSHRRRVWYLARMSKSTVYCLQCINKRLLIDWLTYAKYFAAIIHRPLRCHRPYSFAYSACAIIRPCMKQPQLFVSIVAVLCDGSSLHIYRVLSCISFIGLLQ